MADEIERAERSRQMDEERRQLRELNRQLQIQNAELHKEAEKELRLRKMREYQSWIDLLWRINALTQGLFAPMAEALKPMHDDLSAKLEALKTENTGEL